MRVVVCPSDRHAVGYYRLGLPAMTLMDNGSDIEFTFLEGLPMVDALGNPAISGVTRPAALHPSFDADVLVLQRPMSQFQITALESAQARGIRVVVEVDDNFHAVDPRTEFGRTTNATHLRIVTECCRRADLVTTSTPALAELYAPHGRVVVIPNYVPKAWTEVVAFDEWRGCPNIAAARDWLKDRAIPRVGWTGSIGNHAADLDAARGGVGMAIKEHGARLRVYGGGNEKARDHIAKTVGVEAGAVEVLPWQPMDDYPHELARLTVGIAPLADTAFNHAKSWLKPLEYAACGVPCVMSDTAEYARLWRHYGIGTIARPRSRNWRQQVKALLTIDSYRTEMAERGRQMVREHLSIEDNAYKWAEAWASTLPATA